MWLDATDASTLWQNSAGTIPATTTNDLIGRWTDKTGNGYNHIQTDSLKKPFLITSYQNSNSVISFDGTDYLDGALGLTSLTEASAFIVVKVVTDPPVAGSRTGLWKYGSDPATTHFPYTDGIIYDGFGSTARKTTANPATTLAQWNQYEVLSVSGEWTSWLNGTQLYTTATNTVGWTASPILGSSDGTSIYLEGQIGEVLVYNSALSSYNRNRVEDYLRSKWNLP
jgi:hypothetical protein